MSKIKPTFSHNITDNRVKLYVVPFEAVKEVNIKTSKLVPDTGISKEGHGDNKLLQISNWKR